MSAGPDNSHPAFLTENDLRSIVTLLGEVCSDPGGHADKKRLLLDGICRLVDAQAWVWGLFVQLTPGEFPSYILHLHSGFDEENLASYFQALAHPDSLRFTAPMARLIEEKRSHVTRFRQQFGIEQEYLGSDNQRAWNAAGIDPGILSCRPIDPTTLSTVAIYRRIGGPAFTERESRIVHILLSEVPWLHEQGWSAERASTIPALTPRYCTVLNFLVHGRSRKDIAAHLGITPSTADSYVKDVFRHFHVHSQAALIARFLNGDGGDMS